MHRYELSAATWIKSSYSGDNGGDCIEIAPAFHGTALPVRDSKNPDGPVLVINRSAWTYFITGIRSLP